MSPSKAWYADHAEESRDKARAYYYAHRKPLLAKPTLEDRFWAKVEKTETCWLWTGTRSSGRGYGMIRVDGKMRLAHRVAWELTRGAVPDGSELDHLCRRLACVRPEHLEPVSHRENTRRGIGPTAENARKASCPFGHPYVQATYRNERVCNECRRRKHAERMATAL